VSRVSVTINERSYNIVCDAGQEDNLARLGEYVDRRIGQLAAAVGQVGDDRLLVMVSLLIADELSDALEQLDTLRGSDGAASRRVDAEEALFAHVESIAERVENIASRLELS
jgi:cell division protein ZapA